ncbi:MAG: DinB family protein [Anaerolineae bacterium]|nr:DinB family protein [Anaerolineae bacterium]
MSNDNRRARIRTRLEEARQELLDVLDKITPDTEIQSTENPAWTVHDIVAHVTLSERGLQATVQRFLEGVELPADFSLNVWNERQVKKAANRSLAEMIAAMTGSRQGTLELLESLSDEQMAVEGMHPAGFRTTVAGVFKVMAYHERLHGAEIARALGLPAPRIPAWPGTDVSVTRE